MMRKVERPAAAPGRLLARAAVCLLLLALHVAAQTPPRAGGQPHETQKPAAPIRFDRGKSARKISFELHDNNIYLKARVNDSRPLWFIFDTGAGVSILDAGVAKTLGLKSHDKAEINAGGGNIESTILGGLTVKLTGAAAFDQLMVVTPLDSFPPLVGHAVDGIIGHDFIKQFVVEIDYAARTISLYDPAGYEYAGRGEVIPVEVEGREPLVSVKLSMAGRDVIEGRFTLDTGSTTTLWMSRYFVETHGLLEKLSGASLTRFGAGLGGESKVVHARAREVRLGRFRIDSPVVRLSQEEKGFYAETKYAGTIGGEILRRFKVFLDYPHGRMMLEPSARLAETYEDDMSGLDLTTAGRDFKTFKVIRVTPNTPASEAGLREGDVITKIDGRPARRLTLDIIGRMFKRDGKTYTLQFTRGRKSVRTLLKLKRLI